MRTSASVKGRGLTGKQPGDLYVILQVALPPANSDAAKTLYKQMEDQLEVNLAGAALALDLLERIEELDARLRAMKGGRLR